MSKTEYNISVLLTTTNGTEQLGRSVRSLVERASNPRGVQIILGFDKHDPKSLTYFSKVLMPWLVKNQVAYTALSFNRIEPESSHQYTKIMCSMATGKWLMTWRDDAEMETLSWDSSIMVYDDQFKLLTVDAHDSLLIVPREWYDLLGYISPHPAQERWIIQQANILNIAERTAIKVSCDPSSELIDLADFDSRQQINQRYLDCTKIAQYMKEQRGLDISFFESALKNAQHISNNKPYN